MESIKVFSPGSITNLSCGYDILGLCLESRGDVIKVSKTNKKGITIKSISGFDLTKDVNKNVSGIAAQSLLSNINIDYGFEPIEETLTKEELVKLDQYIKSHKFKSITYDY